MKFLYTPSANVVEINFPTPLRDPRAALLKTVPNGNPLIVKFYAPWCGHCRHFKPKWESVAVTLSKSPVTVGAVSCDVYGDVCKDQEVHGFPTLKAFNVGDVNGGFKTEVIKKTKVKDIVSEGEKQLGAKDEGGAYTFVRNSAKTLTFLIFSPRFVRRCRCHFLVVAVSKLYSISPISEVAEWDGLTTKKVGNKEDPAASVASDTALAVTDVSASTVNVKHDIYRDAFKSLFFTLYQQSPLTLEDFGGGEAKGGERQKRGVRSR